ncbi:MAG: carbohydrate deacetylase [Planctomycetota bacterium]|jgi:hopanoid biosynthesis associated protein HpnK
MDKRMIINADGFGRCEAINKAVAEAHTNGVLTSATIMANMPAATEAVKIAKKLPGLGVGVHLNLFEGPPVSKDSSVDCLLDADGRFTLSVFRLALLSVAGHKFRNALRTEMTAQIQWLLDQGLTPTHLDSYKHIHSFPPVYSIVCELARGFGIAAVRFTFEPKQISSMPWPLTTEAGRDKAKKARIMARINRMQNSDFLKTDALLGVAHEDKIDVNFFRAVTLYTPVATAEVMTHPALADASEQGDAKALHQQQAEVAALCSDRTKKYFDDSQIKLVHYGKL